MSITPINPFIPSSNNENLFKSEEINWQLTTITPKWQETQDSIQETMVVKRPIKPTTTTDNTRQELFETAPINQNNIPKFWSNFNNKEPTIGRYF